jgi:hypothetical protein
MYPHLGVLNYDVTQFFAFIDRTFAKSKKNLKNAGGHNTHWFYFKDGPTDEDLFLEGNEFPIYVTTSFVGYVSWFDFKPIKSDTYSHP